MTLKFYLSKLIVKMCNQISWNNLCSNILSGPFLNGTTDSLKSFSNKISLDVNTHSAFILTVDLTALAILQWHISFRVNNILNLIENEVESKLLSVTGLTRISPIGSTQPNFWLKFMLPLVWRVRLWQLKPSWHDDVQTKWCS